MQFNVDIGKFLVIPKTKLPGIYDIDLDFTIRFTKANFLTLMWNQGDT
jgi:hypothetical protein